MVLPDNISANDCSLSGASPLRATSPVRALLARRITVPERLIAAVLVSETSESDSLLPVFSLPNLGDLAREIADIGIKAVKLFVDSYAPSPTAAAAKDPNSLSCRAIAELKKAVPKLCVITDTCLCSYTVNGDCAIATKSGAIDAQATIDMFKTLTKNQVDAGADIIGPAPMMHGIVAALRRHLDSTGSGHIPLMPHLSWRSSLYRVYRSTMKTGHGTQRQVFQIDPTRPEQFITMGYELKAEGAEILQLQPGLFSLDVVGTIRSSLQVPVALYSVSGEYAMMKASCSNEAEFKEIIHEHATVCLRSGADFLLTYAWKELAKDGMA